MIWKISLESKTLTLNRGLHVVLVSQCNNHIILKTPAKRKLKHFKSSHLFRKGVIMREEPTLCALKLDYLR